MTISIQALCGSLDAGVNLRPCSAPADFLCRVMAGDIPTRDEILSDDSPMIRTLLEARIVARARFIANQAAAAVC